MSSKSNKSKRDGKSSKVGKSANNPKQTVVSMFKKQKEVRGKSKPGDKRKLSTEEKSSKINDDHDSDDDFKIIKVESKSKYFKSSTQEDESNITVTKYPSGDNTSDPQPSGSRLRRHSLRSQNSTKSSLSKIDDLRYVNLIKDDEAKQTDLLSSQKENAGHSVCSTAIEQRYPADGAGDSQEQKPNKVESESGDMRSSIPLSPSKKLSLIKRRSSCRNKKSTLGELKQQTVSTRTNSKVDISNNSVIEVHDDSDRSSSASVTDDCSDDDDDFIDPAKKRKSGLSTKLKKSYSTAKTKQIMQKVTKIKSERKEDNIVESRSKMVSSISRENSKMLWNQLFQSGKKKEEKKSEKCAEEKVLDGKDSSESASTSGIATMANDNEKEPVPMVPASNEAEDSRTKEESIDTETGSNLEAGINESPSQDIRAAGDHVDEADVSQAGAVVTEEGQTKYRTPYYLENFRTIMTAVLGDEDNYRLFDDEDKNYIEVFNKLSECGQKLYVRLFSRKLTWLPVNKISYPEINSDLTDTLQELVDNGLAMSESDLTDLEQTLKVMSAADLKTLAKTFHINGSGLTKPQTCEALLKKSKQSTVSSMFGGGGKGAGPAMLARAKKLLGQSFRLLDIPRRVFVRVLMLFSVIHSSLEDDQANGGQPQLYQMLLVNMGKVVYPQFTVNKQTSLIKDREGLFRFERAMQYESDLAGFIEKNNWTGAYDIYMEAKEELDTLMMEDELVSFDKALPLYLRSCTAGCVLTKVLSQGIEILQRRKDYPGAVSLIKQLLEQDVYCQDYHGYWWERLSLNLEFHLKKPLEALEAIGKGLSDPTVKVGHRLALYQRAEKLCTSPNSKYKHRMKEFPHDDVIEAPKGEIRTVIQKLALMDREGELGYHILEGRVLPHSIPGLRFNFMTEDSYADGNTEDVTVCGVEELVLSHYRNNGYPEGLHAEGSIISSLFNLYFWDVLYMDVPDAFHSPYQTRPLDFHSEMFYERRKDAIDQRLQELEEGNEEKLHELMAETWNVHNGEMCAGLNWERFKSLEHCQGLVSCIQGKVLAGMMRRYATNPRHTRSGFPDLTLWNPDTKVFKICEVKGPGDRLSHKQILWLDHLLKLGVDAEVCHVKAVGAKKLKPTATVSSSTSA